METCFKKVVDVHSVLKKTLILDNSNVNERHASLKLEL